MTTEQENKVLAMLNAYENGKRLVDLPNASGNNPFDMTVEVLEDGESKQAKLASLLPNIEDDVMYGVQWDITSSDPKVIRIGNLALHRTLPIQNRMRGCLLDDNGQVVKYLNPLDWTSEVRDGSKGQVMVELPMHYRKFETDGNIRRVKISEYPLAGYHQVPTCYVSAYEAALDRTNSSTPKLASVVNMTTAFRGGANKSEWDGTFRTLLGRPATVISRTNFRKYARNRNGDATSEWNCYTIGIHEEIYWLYVIEYANRNSQAAYNAALDSNGYKQGGLGMGVTTIGSTIADGGEHDGEATEDWNTFNSVNPFVPCGHTDSLGNRTGVVEYAVHDDITDKWEDQMVPRYRGIENPFGHIWKWTDGISIMIKPDTDANPTSDVYTCQDSSKFNDSNYDGYICVGQEARTEGYVKDINFGEYGSIMPKTVGGGSTSYFCDYHYTNIPSATTLRGVLLGGDANRGSSAGLAFAFSANAPSSADTRIGSRLCFIPAKA